MNKQKLLLKLIKVSRGAKIRNRYNQLLYTYKKYPLILPVFLHQNTKSCITLLAFSDSVSPSSIVYPRRTIFTPNSPTAMSPRINSSENITATGLGRFVQILNKTGDQYFLCYRTILR